MKVYRMRKIADSQYGYVVFSANYVNPLDQKRIIEGELSRKSFSGYVIFDLLLAVGDADNRFLELFFDGTSFDMKTISVVNNVRDAIRKEAARFYISNEDFLSDSILTRPAKFRIKQEAQQ